MRKGDELSGNLCDESNKDRQIESESSPKAGDTAVPGPDVTDKPSIAGGRNLELVGRIKERSDAGPAEVVSSQTKDAAESQHGVKCVTWDSRLSVRNARTSLVCLTQRSGARFDVGFAKR